MLISLFSRWRSIASLRRVKPVILILYRAEHSSVKAETRNVSRLYWNSTRNVKLCEESRTICVKGSEESIRINMFRKSHLVKRDQSVCPKGPGKLEQQQAMLETFCTSTRRVHGSLLEFVGYDMVQKASFLQSQFAALIIGKSDFPRIEVDHSHRLGWIQLHPRLILAGVLAILAPTGCKVWGQENAYDCCWSCRISV